MHPQNFDTAGTVLPFLCILTASVNTMSKLITIYHSISFTKTQKLFENKIVLQD